MPANPAEVAVITALGQVFSQWEWCEFERRIGQVTAHLRVRVMEVTPPQRTSVWSNLRLRPGDRPVTVTLAGRLVMDDGIVTLRQGAISGTSHQIEIVASSKTTHLPLSTPMPPAPQFKNSSFLQIANALTAPYGISVYLRGNTPGAEKTFKRVSIHPGETVLQAIERLAAFRNLHLVDDADGNLVAGRGDDGAGASVADLVEGQNIEAGHVVMSIDEAIADVWGHGQSIADDTTNSDAARDVAAIAKSTGTLYRPGIVIAEQPVDQGDLLMRTDFEAATSLGTVVEVSIKVPGWTRPDGSLWCEYLWQPVTIYSPMLFPTDGIVLSIRGVKHRQSNEEGTVSIIECCLPKAISAGFPTGDGTFPPGNQPAIPAAPDD